MIRRLFTILSTLSLLLWIIVAVIWVRSYFVGDEFCRWSGYERLRGWTLWAHDSLYIGRGGISFDHLVESGSGDLRKWIDGHHQERGYPRFHRTTAPEYPASWLREETTLGFSFYQKAIRVRGYRPRYSILVVVPLWSLSIAFSILPCLWLWRWRAAQERMASGHCLTCG